MERLLFIDRLKGLAIISVIMGHVYLFSMHAGRGLWYEVICSFHMPLFLFISGYVCMRFPAFSNLGVKRWLTKIIRLLLPMWWFGLLFTLYTTGWPTSIEAFWEKVIVFLAAPAKMGYWYLMSLSVFYCTLQLFRLNRANRFGVDLLIGIGMWGIFWLGRKYLAQSNDLFCLINCSNFYPFFMGGVMVRKYGLMDKLSLHKNNWLFTFSLIGYVILFNFETDIHFLEMLRCLVLMPFCAVVVLLMAFSAREKSLSIVENMLSFVGRHTLDIYVIHYFVLSLFRLDGIGLWLEETGNSGFSLLFVTAVALIISFASICLGLLIRKSCFFRKFVYGEF